MSQDTIDTFMAITSAESSELAQHFLEMAGGNLETAISLFFEHGGNAQLNNRNSNTSSILPAGNSQFDEQPNDDGYRAPDPARHEALVDTHVFSSTFGGVGGRFEPLRHVRGMFDETRPQGIFNQQLNIEEGDEDSEFSEEENYESDHVYEEETVMEIDEDGAIREHRKLVRKPRAVTKEQRLAMLFKPPFDMMAKVDLDGAKIRGRERQKWIMINIQAVDIFQCQAINRDIWAHKDVKKLVKENFIFLQYQFDSQNAQPYIQFYGPHDKEELPHIAILDPITGERVKQWNHDVPNLHSFIEEVTVFLSQFSLHPGSTNPTVREPTPKLDPTLLSEEQQMELAIQESLNRDRTAGPTVDTGEPADTELLKSNDQHASVQGPTEDPHVPLFNSILPLQHPEPSNQLGVTTRIQIRIGDGRRLVRRFNAMEDTVRTIFEVLKSEVDGLGSQYFTLSDHARENLLDKLDETISDAGLKNSSLLLELISE
ncbi:LADA_0F11584g1_1 [Lachancea dasiensis]|uniref:LADA_0F11584g1_1 n=1 Tax=Lachancea dasiensis TaxID=1072105 RepID=A0A1G4JME4_9SACH|nr:LADA_0F11584g1_1 [Lachancea dasiensis]